MTIAARKPYQPLVAYIAKSVAYNTPNIGTADMVQIGTLPANCIVTGAIVRVGTAFNAGTTNVLVVGTSGGSNADIVAAGDVNEGATGTTLITTGLGLSITADTPIYAKFTETGTAATAGAADVVVTYIPSIV